MEKSVGQWMTEPLRRYAEFSGRSRRKEYWWFALFGGLIGIVLSIVDLTLGGTDALANALAGAGVGPFGGLFALAMIVPNLAVSFRRLHDLDKSAWWVLLGLIPIIGGLILLFWFVQRGTIGSNRFGADPVTD